MLTLIVVFFVAIALIFLLCYYFAGGKYDLNHASLRFKIPGLDEGFVPQGLCYVRPLNVLLVSGYMATGQPSRVYVISAESGEALKYVCFKDRKMAFLGHSGGVSCFSGSAYISSEGKIFRFSLADLEAAKSGDFINFESSLETGNGADFCCVNNGYIFSGEFYKFRKFPTDLSHHIMIDQKLQNSAVIFAFKLSQNGEFASRLASFAISIPDMVQGMEFVDNNIWLSSSYGLSKSKLSVYSNVLSSSATQQISFKQQNVPLFVLSGKDLKRCLTLPPMAEEIALVNEQVLVLFESASKKYKKFNRVRIKNIYGFKIE